MDKQIRRAVFLPVLSLLAPAFLRAEEGLRPIRGPIVPGFWEENRLWLLPTIVLGSLVLILLFWIAIKWSNRPLLLSPRQRLDLGIADLEKRVFSGEVADLAYQLSMALREYIEATTGLNAPEKTTEEFLETITSGSLTLPGEAETSLRKFLETSDRAKFGNRSLSQAEIQELFAEARTCANILETNQTAAE